MTCRVPDLVDVEGLYGRVESEVLIVGQEGFQHGVHTLRVLVRRGWHFEGVHDKNTHETHAHNARARARAPGSETQAGHVLC